MYQTVLDSLVQTISNDLYNHKYYRPYIDFGNIKIRHLLLPDIPIYIFNFVFESTVSKVDSHLVDIDMITESAYGSPFCYPLLLFINGLYGLQDVAGKNVYLPKRLTEFANKYKDKYENTYEIPLNDLPQIDKILHIEGHSESELEDLRNTFGPIFAEA